MKYNEQWSREEGAKRASEVFYQAFTAQPAGVWASPGRVNIIGEHTDYNGGMALPIALEHATYVAASRRADRKVRLASAQMPGVLEYDLDAIGEYDTAARVDSWAAYVLGVIVALEARTGQGIGGFDFAVDSCVPFGAGLSSSAALECAAAIAVDELASLGFSGDDEGRKTLVEACVWAENRMAGASTGGMDQAASLRCHAGYALNLDCKTGRTQPVPFDLQAAELSLLIIDTRAPHSLADGQYENRRRACEVAAQTLGVEFLADLPWRISQAWLPDEALARKEKIEALFGPIPEVENAQYVHEYALWARAGGGLLDYETLRELLKDLPEEQRKRTRHVVGEIARTVALKALLDGGALESDWQAGLVAALLDASHESLRLDYEVTCGQLDVAVASARAAGAWAARMTGGGFGGSAIALVPTESFTKVAEQVAHAFAEAGFADPEFLASLPAESGRKVS